MPATVPENRQISRSRVGPAQTPWHIALPGRRLLTVYSQSTLRLGRPPDYHQRTTMRLRSLVAIVLAFSVTASARPAPTSLAAIDRDIKAGVYGYVDALYVLRDGQAAFDARYPHDYRAISHGRTGPLGCGD